MAEIHRHAFRYEVGGFIEGMDAWELLLDDTAMALIPSHYRDSIRMLLRHLKVKLLSHDILVRILQEELGESSWRNQIDGHGNPMDLLGPLESKIDHLQNIFDAVLTELPTSIAGQSKLLNRTQIMVLDGYLIAMWGCPDNLERNAVQADLAKNEYPDPIWNGEWISGRSLCSAFQRS